MAENGLKRAVVYTAIFGGYDAVQLHPIQEGVTVDYVVFTDNPNLEAPSSYRVCVATKRPDLGPALRNFYYRLYPFEQEELDGYDLVVYLDGNCQIADGGFVASLLASPLVMNHALTISRHPHRDCAYAEATFSVRQNAKYDEIGIGQQIHNYKCDGLPPHWGLWWTGFLVYSRQAGGGGDDNVAALARTCMEHAAKYNPTNGQVPQGQVIFPYAAWKHGALFHTLPAQFGGAIQIKYHIAARAYGGPR